MNRWTAQLLPPELLGSHIASPRSHSTGRRHDLSFRAATAVFGHLGIEWDLTTATPEDLVELREWVSFYKANRVLLNRGDLIRLDIVDPTLLAYGVIASDRSSAIYTVASVGRSEVMLPGRLRFPGLNPQRRYRDPANRGRTSTSGPESPALVGCYQGDVRSVGRTSHHRLGAACRWWPRSGSFRRHARLRPE